MSFDGSLIKLWNGTEYVNFPLKYVYKESYKITPNRRQDLNSTRNSTGVLVRNVLSHTASTIELSSKPMWNTELAEMMSFISSKYEISKEKKLKIKYYAPDTDSYKDGYFYVPDIQFPINRIVDDGNTHKIFYNSVKLEFIEY